VSASTLYDGIVFHARLRPARHDLRYRIFMGLFDLDELPALARENWAFGYNRPGLISFYDRDHGDGSGAPLRPQIEAALGVQGLACDGPIRVLCMPRVMGYVFNPISVYFCFNRAERLTAIVHEVNNTFGERHLYALPAEPSDDARVLQACDKAFRVSPFLPIGLKYQFRIEPPADRTAIAIAASSAEGVILTASFSGERRAFSSLSILRLWLAHPALTFKVIAGIHWEALWIWLKLRRVQGQPPAATARAL